MRYLIATTIQGYLSQKIDGFVEEHRESSKKENLPYHCTLLSTQLDDSKEPEVVSALEEMVSSKSQFPIQFGTLAMYDGGALVIEIQKTKKLDKLHKSIWRNTRPYLKKNELKIPDRHNSDRGRVEALRTCGSSYAGKFYSPHITTFHPDLMKFGFEWPKFKNHFGGDSYVLSEISLWKKQDSWEELKKFKVK